MSPLPAIDEEPAMDPTRTASDELAIRNLLAALAHAADDAEDLRSDYVGLFTDDAVWEGQAFGRRSGRADILAGARERRAAGSVGPGSHTRHVLTTTHVRVDGDAAEARSVFLFYTATNHTPRLETLGVYEDELRRSPSGWKLAHRRIRISGDGT
jgi:hypothetical protein